MNGNFGDICRICLKNNSTLNNLFETNAPDMLKFCGFLEVDESDKFPDKICVTCSNSLKESYELKQLCISSKLYLQSLLEAQQNLEVTVKMVNCIADPEFTSVVQSEGAETKNDIPNNDEFSYECSEYGDLNVCDGPYSTVISSKEPNISTHDCSPNSEEEKVNEPFSESHCTVNEVPHPSNDVKYQCPQCKTVFEHQQDLFVHQSIHGGDDHICNLCKKTFRTMKMLKRHLKTHMITKSHICKICNKGFAEASELVKHERRLHLGIPREKNYECTECGQRFTDHYYLKVHQRKHTGEKPLECDICHRGFYDPRSLKVHLDAHKGIKPYLCSYCGKSFVQNAHLRQHIIVHTTEKPYSCTVCNKRFTQSTSLQRHQKVHLVMHKCDICSDEFSKIHQLYRHKEEEHGIKRKRERKRTT